MTKIYVIVPAYNSPERVQKLLTSLQETMDTTPRAKVLVSYEDPHFSGPLGFTENVNDLLGKVMADPEVEHIFLSGDDVQMLTKGWMNKMLAYATQHPDVGLIGPQEISERNGGVLAPMGGQELGLWEYGWGKLKPGEGQIIEIPFPNFAFAYIKAELVRKIGFLDSEFSPGVYDDYDYGVRAWLEGYRSVWLPSIQFNHIRGATWAPLMKEGTIAYPERQGTYFHMKYAWVPILGGEPDNGIIAKLKMRSKRKEWNSL